MWLGRFTYLAHTWLPTVQEVLHADWQDTLHWPQPPVLELSCSLGAAIVKICLLNGLPPCSSKISQTLYHNLPVQHQTADHFSETKYFVYSSEFTVSSCNHHV